MPLVDGKKFAYTPEGLREAAEARRANPEAPSVAPMAPKAKRRRKGYNFTKNLGRTPGMGY